MDILLLAGLWLPSSIWSDTAAELEQLGYGPTAVQLPGADIASTSATLNDQIDAVVTAIDAVKDPVVVGHSAASTLAWIAADRRPDRVKRVVVIGGFPSSNGAIYADFFPTRNGVMPFPGWDPFDGPDSADLNDAHRERIATEAIAVPEGVSNGIVELSDERRFDVPVAVVCPEFSPDEARGWVDNGDAPELARVSDVLYHNIATGHWPMVTQPAQLARVLHEAINSTRATRGTDTSDHNR